MTGSTSFRVATSNTCSEPSSLPFRDIETASRFPSGDGTNQSIAVVPFGSSAFGSTITCMATGSSARPSTAIIGCCFGGWVYSAKTCSPTARRFEKALDVADACRMNRSNIGLR